MSAITSNIKTYLRDFLSLVYPHLCLACQQDLNSGEDIICLDCQYTLPETGFDTIKDNPVEKLFWGRVPLEAATSYYFFSKGSRIQRLMHQLKYKDREDVGELLGEWFGRQLKKSPRFNTIDFILPVPLHRVKEKRRGYNQADSICRGLSKGMEIPWERDILIRTAFSETQTKKGRMERWENVNKIFSITDSSKIEGKHLLLVDDVVTTGSTMDACSQVLLKEKDIKISIATIACAYGT